MLGSEDSAQTHLLWSIWDADCCCIWAQVAVVVVARRLGLTVSSISGESRVTLTPHRAGILLYAAGVHVAFTVKGASTWVEKRNHDNNKRSKPWEENGASNMTPEKGYPTFSSKYHLQNLGSICGIYPVKVKGGGSLRFQPLHTKVLMSSSSPACPGWTLLAAR